MKNRITLLWFFLLTYSFVSNGQSKMDSIRLAQLDEKIKNLYEFKGNFSGKGFEIEYYINRVFCGLNVYTPEKADSLIRFYLSGSESLKPYGQSCFVRNYHCLTPAQKKLIKEALPHYINSKDLLFHKLISLYDLRVYTDYLLENIRVINLSEALKEDIKDGSISQALIYEMRSMAVLANFGYEKYEDEIITAIKEFYPIVIKLVRGIGDVPVFYYDIIPNSLALLNSKRSVMETLFLLDETRFNHDGGDDTTPEDFAKIYYGFVIEPKIKSFGVRNMMSMHFDKKRFKKILAEDDTIWWDYIRR